MKKLNLLLGLILFSAFVFAQDAETESKWKWKGQTGLNFTQTSFTNWSAGGENSYSLVWNANFALDYKAEKSAWNNTLDLGYGLTKQGEQDIRKMVDKIDFLSKYSFNGFSDKWRYTALLNFKTQFDEGFDYKASNQQILTSRFFAPAYLTGSFGLEYLGSDKLKIFISPVSEKTTFVSSAYYEKKIENYVRQVIREEYLYSTEEPIGEEFEEEFFLFPEEQQEVDSVLKTSTTYGLGWDENVKMEIGALAQIIYDNPEVIKNVGFKTRLDLFAAYANIDKVDIDWELWLTFKINKYLSANINAQFIYDDDIKFQKYGTDALGNPTVKNIPKIQFRELFGVGLVYTFN